MADLYWDEDGVDGRPSSMEVLLQWLSDPENAKRWQMSSRQRDGTRGVLVREIHTSLLAHGIAHRTRGSVDVKVWGLMHSFEKVEHWLQRKEIRHLEPNSRAERKVLKTCPYYPELARLLQPTRSAVPTNSQTHSRDELSTRTTEDFEYTDDEEVDALDIGSKRVSDGDEDDISKHFRVEDHGGNAAMCDGDRLRLLEAEKAVRRELFKLEVQAKRDEAICVRVKSRKELLELGVPIEEVERLMPL